MHSAPLSFLIYLLYFKTSYLLNRCKLDPCVYDVFDSESALELNPEVVTLTPGSLYILLRAKLNVGMYLPAQLYIPVKCLYLFAALHNLHPNVILLPLC
jgi:hypothetical protein